MYFHNLHRYSHQMYFLNLDHHEVCHHLLICFLSNLPHPIFIQQSFREQYGINQPLLPSEYPSCHPSSNPSPSPYPMASDTSALSAALPQGMRSASSASASASAAPSRAMLSSSILAQPSSASQIP